MKRSIKNKKKSGRKPLDGSRATETINRVTKERKKLYKSFAAKHGLSITEWIKKTLDLKQPYLFSEFPWQPNMGNMVSLIDPAISMSLPILRKNKCS